MSATANRAQAAMRRKADSLRSTPVGAIWPGLPARDRHLLLWLLSGDMTRAVTIVTKRGVAPRYASLFASLFANDVTGSNSDMTPHRARGGRPRKADSLRYPSPVGTGEGDPRPYGTYTRR